MSKIGPRNLNDICCYCCSPNIISGSDGVYCKQCKRLESWDSYEDRTRER